MPSPFGDDDQFPDRPDHPDFWRLSDVVLQQDGALQEAVDKDAEYDRIIAEHVDLDSVMYLAQQRAQRVLLEQGFGLNPDAVAMVSAAYLTGVVAGIAFEKKGGHRAP